MMSSFQVKYSASIAAPRRRVCAEANAGPRASLPRSIERRFLTFIYAIAMMDRYFSGSTQAAKNSHFSPLQRPRA
jgi:hypothetical protein